MRNLFFILILSMTSATIAKASDSTAVTPTVTKWTDISAWQTVRIREPQKGPILWFNHEEIKYFIETRLNFDWSNTIGLIAGKTFSKSAKFWVTPKAGVLVGASKDAFNGTTIETNLGGQKKKFSYFTMTQFAFSFQKKTPGFFYEFVNLAFNINKYFSLSAAGQTFQPLNKGDKPDTDIGPQVTVTVKKFYLKLWYTGDPYNKRQKMIFGLGYQF